MYYIIDESKHLESYVDLDYQYSLYEEHRESFSKDVQDGYDDVLEMDENALTDKTFRYKGHAVPLKPLRDMNNEKVPLNLLCCNSQTSNLV